MECWTCEGMGHLSGKCPESQCFLCYKKGHTAQFCPEKSVNLASLEDETNLNYIKRIPRKMGKSLLAPRPKYNLIQDMFQQRAEITYGQLLEYPEHRAALETALNLSKDQINITEEYEKPPQYTPIKVYTRIKGNAILAILDTGACMSVVTKPLAVALGLRWKLSTRTDVIAVNGKSQAAVGVVDSISVVIADAQTFIPLQVINSTTKILLLGTDWLDKYKADVLSNIKKLRFVSQEKTIEVDVVNARDQMVKEPILSNLCALWKQDDEAAEIEFYYDEVEKVCLHLAENPVEVKQVMNQLPTSVKRLLNQFKDVVAQHKDDLRRTNVLKHKINLIHLFPITARPKSFDPTMQRKMKQEVQDLLRRGIIRPSTSPYSASISVVEKKDGTIRIYSTPIGLNAATIDDEQPLPNMRELMDAIARAKYYLSWDLISRFWQIEIEEGDKVKTAFSTSWGHYEYNVMPFGLKGAPATFQRLMTKVLGPYLYDFVMVYLDNIIIFFQTIDEHLQHMRKVLEALRQAGLKLKLEKCEFAKK